MAFGVKTNATADKGTDIYVDYRATLKYFAEQPIKMQLPPVATSALDMLVLECTEFIEPYIPEDQERDEAGQPRKKARLEGSLAPGDIKPESTNGGSPIPHNGPSPLPAAQTSSAAAVVSTPTPVPNHAAPAISRPPPSTMSTYSAHRPVDLARPAPPPTGSSPYSSPFFQHQTMAQAMRPSPRPDYSPFDIGSSWTSVGSKLSKPSAPTVSSAARPLGLQTPTPASASQSIRPASAQEDSLTSRWNAEREKRLELERARARELDAERERQRSEMRSHAERIVEDMRKEGINGSAS